LLVTTTVADAAPTPTTRAVAITANNVLISFLSR
jgi:hypothetical protein